MREMFKKAKIAKLLLLDHSCNDCQFYQDWPGHAAQGVHLPPECRLRYGGKLHKMNICELWEMRGNERFTDGQ